MKRTSLARPTSGGTSAVALLLALLQRSPADRLIEVTETVVASTPVTAVLRAATLVAGALGIIDTLAGATTLQATTASPLSATTGANVQVGFTVLNTINIGSWKVGGALPPGLTMSALEGGNKLTGPGTLDATTPGVSDGYGGMSGANATTTPILTGTPTQPGSYTFTLQAFEFGNLQGLASSTFDYTITVASAVTSTAPAFSAQPHAATVTAGGSVTFTVTVTGSPPPAVQWQKDGTTIAGATSTTLALANVKTTDAGAYTAVATNSAGTVASTAAQLTVTPVTTGSAPAFTLQPVSQTMATGNSVVFNSAATGATSYQWQKNGAAIAGATSATLLLPNAGTADAGAYAVIATNATGSTTSAAATLAVNTVAPSTVGHLANVSVRTFSGTGDQLLNVGFSVGGAGTSGNKPLLVRVTGPALAAFGVGGTMTDPTLVIRPLGSTTTVASNDDWSGDASVASLSPAVGAFGLSDSNSKDAATVASLASGTYTVLAGGKNNGTGIVLTEIYDATASGSFSSTTPRLVNVSARAQAGTGDGILTTGFAIAGSTAKTLLIRATGPALAAFGVGGTLTDPKLQVYQLGGPKLYENDNWGGAAVIANAATQVGAFGIADPNSKDAALLVTLPPGVYTAQVSGADGGTGVALIEVYELP